MMQNPDALLEQDWTTEVQEDFSFSYARPEQSRFDQMLIRTVERLSGQSELEELYRTWSAKRETHRSFFAAALDLLDVTFDIDDGAGARIPATGPVLFLANHPFGVIDGLGLGHVVTRVRPDLKIMTHSLLCQVPEVQPYLLPVDFAGTRAAQQTTLATRRRTLDWLSQGHAVGVFPGGGIATAQRPLTGPALELPWHVFVARLLAVPGVTIVPVRFHGQNSRLFQVASHLHYAMRIALIFHETRRRRRTTVKVTVGEPIAAAALPAGDRAAVIDGLRRMTLSLGEAKPEAVENCFTFPSWIKVD